MKVVCAWCHKLLKPGTGPEDAEVSHGICKDCYRVFLRKLSPDRTLSEFLEELPVPVLVVDGDGGMLAINSQARDLTGRQSEDLPGLRAGDVIACVNARSPGGCGRTENCLGCEVREAIEGTYASGEPREQVTAIKEVTTPSGVRPACFRIATRKLGQTVLLRIDEADAAA